MKKLFLAAIFFSAVFSLFAEVTIVNPVPGSYANLQSLVIESNGGEEIYYSFSGSDPLTQGFAYDGPVVLEVTGNIELRVAIVDKSQNKSERKVYFSVDQVEVENEEKNAFLRSFETGPCFDFTAGSKLSIPFSMTYSFFQSDSYEKGRELSISKKATMERFVPINLSDGKNLWRYVLRLLPLEPGALSKKDFPFAVSDWTKLVLLDRKCIFSLDGQWWRAAGEVIELDRSRSNFVYFQSADFSAGNPIQKVELAAKPLLKVERDFDGCVVISVQGQSQSGEPFYLAPSQSSKTKLVSEGLHSQLVIDAFYGDKIDERIDVDVYCGQAFQGSLSADVFVNRSTPNPPQIVSSAKSSYARDDVQIYAKLDPQTKTFFAVSNPLSIEPSFEPADLSLANFVQGDFYPYQGQKITLYGDTEKIMAYKVSFYAEDQYGSKSQTVDAVVAIDKYNYYVNPDSQVQEQDGSPLAPFKDLSRLSKIANKKSFSRFYIKGSVPLNPGENTITNNVEFCGVGDARISFPAASVIALKNAGLYAENVFFEKAEPPVLSKKLRGAAKALTNMFIFERSAATLKNCQVSARFSGDGSVFNCLSSALSLESTGLASEAQGYSNLLSLAGQSKAVVKNCRLLCVADTGVAISANGGSVNIENNFAQVTARVGRPAEFADCSIRLVGNKFTLDIQNKSQDFNNIYLSGKSVFTENKGNIYK